MDDLTQCRHYLTELLPIILSFPCCFNFRALILLLLSQPSFSICSDSWGQSFYKVGNIQKSSHYLIGRICQLWGVLPHESKQHYRLACPVRFLS